MLKFCLEYQELCSGGSFPGMQDWPNIKKSINGIYYIDKLKKEKNI